MEKLYKYLFNQINMFDFCVMNHNVIMSVFLRKIYAQSNVFFSGKSTIIYWLPCYFCLFIPTKECVLWQVPFIKSSGKYYRNTNMDSSLLSLELRWSCNAYCVFGTLLVPLQGAGYELCKFDIILKCHNHACDTCIMWCDYLLLFKWHPWMGLWQMTFLWNTTTIFNLF